MLDQSWRTLKELTMDFNATGVQGLFCPSQDRRRPSCEEAWLPVVALGSRLCSEVCGYQGGGLFLKQGKTTAGQ